MTYFIPYNTPSSKNSRIWTGTHSVVSKTVSKWKRKTKMYFVGQRDDFLREVMGLPKPYFIHLTFRRNSRRRFDYGNASQAVLDSMVEHRWIEDDNADIVVPVYGKYSYNKVNPGVVIRLIKEKPIYQF